MSFKSNSGAFFNMLIFLVPTILCWVGIVLLEMSLTKPAEGADEENEMEDSDVVEEKVFLFSLDEKGCRLS